MSWDDMLAQVDRTTAAFFDTEAFTATDFHRPSGRSVNAPPVAEGANAAFPFKGSIDFGEAINAMGQSSRWSPDDVAPRHVTQVCISASTVDWPWMPRPGDRLVREKDGVAYTVALVAEDGTGRKVFWVNRGR
ncbi:hypothetical protein Sa4125_25150 [Aureimonas sp. SA4125]|uniref:hypothetical protein n=1 Tax=Aureimonas sp. SA4125 TaxID=2826993 RepID=UPI001CC590CF|nr:hypothetical protein [Aureimonas sp. SA4125]BDA84973.1 hypothetical protein Sa4125_25150 [Aureimonas sp. SA4125]